VLDTGQSDKIAKDLQFFLGADWSAAFPPTAAVTTYVKYALLLFIGIDSWRRPGWLTIICHVHHSHLKELEKKVGRH